MYPCTTSLWIHQQYLVEVSILRFFRKKVFLQGEHGTYCIGPREQKVTGQFSRGSLISRLGYLLGFRVILCPDPFKLIQVVWS